MANKNLTNAKSAKKDEFYTQMIDIENELQHYTKHFKGKVVYCNCDDPHKSNFVKYFYEKFETLGLKKLIASCYVDNSIDLFNQNPTDKATYFEYSGIDNIELKPTFEDIDVKHLNGNGDFRSVECIELLKQSDIVVTNPPFSLFRDFITLLFQYHKKFLIIGNMNAIGYKELFPYIKNNELWLGVSIRSGDREFKVPFDYPLQASTYRIDNYGNKYIRVKGVRWFTNVEHNIQNKKLTLTKTYYGNESDYPKYDNYDAIEVSKTKDIPIDYNGAMGVPISFIDKYNPEQFDILGADFEIQNGDLTYLKVKDWKGKVDRGYIKEKRIYSRIIIKHK